MLDFVQRVMSAYLIHALVSLYPLTESLFEANRQSMVIVHELFTCENMDAELNGL